MPAETPHSGLQGAPEGHATVGMVDRPAWGFGGDHAFGGGEVIRVRQPIPSIVVQSIGSPLPAFATVRPYVDSFPNYELDLIHDALWLADPQPAPPARLLHIAPEVRFVCCAEPLAAGLGHAAALPPTDFLIAADPTDLAVVAEALALTLSGQVLICVDFLDLCLCAGWAPGRRARGRAVVIEGLGDAETAKSLRAWINAPTQSGFDEGLVIAQLATGGEATNLSLAAVDAFFEAALSGSDCRAVATISSEASVTAVVALGFGKAGPREGDRQ